MFCVKCGTQAPEGARFCRACGAELRASAPVASAVAPQVAPPVAGPPAAAPVAYAPAPIPQPTPSPGADTDAARPAGFWRRALAALLDGIVVWLLWLAFSAVYELGVAAWFGSREFAPDGRELLGALSAASLGRNALGAFVYLAYFALAEASPMGATIGKRLLGMRVTRLDGWRAGVVRSLMRNLLKGLSAALLMVGFAMAGFTKRKQGLHDLMTGTLVVRRASAPSSADGRGLSRASGR